ncbi:uncharacterized protein LOC117175910 [Belonocnema kinseyi]|uniref:uncharacterized protein LOC117175910 n=1 Tax=Belonocnema kinseyi TaxID=2817044 RepID=UPI00143DAAE9|nr:uncharacterized protein LOC117175910 [Belonocnema kinseyi]
MQKQFREDQESLLRTCSFNVADENLECNVKYPCIAIRSLEGDNIENEEPSNVEDVLNEDQKQNRFLLFLDGKVVLKCATFVNALQILIATYFVFNQTYPKTHACTLLFLQMYLLNISSPNTTCRAKSEVSKRKVFTLFKALQKINIADFDPI